MREPSRNDGGKGDVRKWITISTSKVFVSEWMSEKALKDNYYLAHTHSLYVLPALSWIFFTCVWQIKIVLGNRVTSIKMVKLGLNDNNIQHFAPEREESFYIFFPGGGEDEKEDVWISGNAACFLYGKVKETIVTIYHSTIRLIIILMRLCVYIPHTIYVFLVFVTALNVMFIDFCSACCCWMENEKHNRTSREWEVKKLKEW